MKQLSFLFILLPFLLYYTASADEIDSLRIVVRSTSGIEKIKNLNLLSEAVVYTDPNESLRIGKRAYLLAEENKNEVEKYKALKNIGYANGYLGNFDESIKNMEDGLAYYKSKGDSVKIAEALSDIGYLKIALSDFSIGADLYKEALDIREKINDRKGISYSLNNLGTLYWQWGKPDDALRYYQQAIPYLKENNLKEEYATVLGNMGVIYKDKTDYKQAIIYFEKSLDLNKLIKHNIGIAKTQNNIALVYTEMGEMEKALQFFQGSAAVSEKTGDKEQWAISMHNLGDLYLKLNQFDFAVDWFNRSISVSQLIHSKTLLLRNFEGLSEAYKKQGNYKLAFEFLEKEKNLNDSIFNEESHRQIEELKTKYETEKKAVEIISLQQKNETQLEILKKRKLYIYIILVIAAFSLLQVHLSYIRRKAILERKTVTLEQKLLRLQMNPHFIFNSITTIQAYILNNSKKDAVNYLSSFSSLMRLILENSATEFIPFEKERKTLEFYLQLQSLRFSDKFDYSIIIEDEFDAENMMIPPMLGQPFIENAIEHGLKGISEKGKIDIRFCLKGNKMLFEVEDNGIGINKKDKNTNNDRKSMAIGITKDRLEIVNRKQKNKLSFEIIDKQEAGVGRGTLIRFTIPVKKQF